MHVTVPEKICKHCKQPRTVFRLAKSRVCLKCHNRHKVLWLKARPKLRMVTLAKHRAKRDGVPFDITVDDFEIPELCPVFKIPLVRGTGIGGSHAASPTLDRIIPALGYVKENVVVISKRANAIKHDATSAELRTVADWLDGVTNAK